MQDKKNSSKIQFERQKVLVNKKLSIYGSLIPVVFLMILLAYNIFFIEGQEWMGAYTNQFILLIGGGIAAIIGFYYKVSLKTILIEIVENLKSVFVPISGTGVIYGNSSRFWYNKAK